MSRVTSCIAALLRSRRLALPALFVSVAPACGSSPLPPDTPPAADPASTADPSTPAKPSPSPPVRLEAVLPPPPPAPPADEGANHIPKIHMEAATIGPKLDPALFIRVLRKNRAPFEQCADAAQERQSDAAYRVGIAFVVGLDGSVSAANVVSADPSGAQDPLLEECIEVALTELRFPELDGGSVTVRMPLRLGEPGRP